MAALVWLSISTGFAVSCYLLFRSLALVAGDESGAIDLCSRFFAAGCEAALSSPSSWALGIPVAGWGIVYFAVIASLLLLPRLVGRGFEVEGAAAALVVGAAGVLVTLLLSGAMILGRAPFCPLCAVVHVANLALLPLLWRTSEAGPGRLRGSLAAGWRFMTGREAGSAETGWKALAFISVGLVAIVLHQWMLIEVGARRSRAEPVDPGAIRGAFAAAPLRDLRVDAQDPRLGPLDAPARIVVFSSFECPGCRKASKLLYDLRRAHGDRLCVVFKHLPLGTACNPGIVEDLHPLACEAARAAEAAHRQGRFWAYHDALFASDWSSGSGPSFEAMATQVGLDLARFRVDRASAEVAAEVARDIETGNHLEVTATPTVFLDGHEVPRLSRSALELLVSDQLRRAGHHEPSSP